MSDQILINDIKEELYGIIDPDLNLTLEELDALQKVEIEGSKVKIYLSLVQPVYWVAEKINNACSELLKKVAPSYESEIYVTEITPPSANKDVLTGVKNIIAVSSGKGGVGKSAIAANLAAALSLSGAKVGILDADVYGPSQPTMFGLEGQQLLAEENPNGGKPLAVPNEAYGIKVASMGFILNRDQAAVVRGPMLAGYFTMLFEQINWGELDFLIFDLPPGTGDIQLTLTQRVPLTGAVVVTTPQEIALADVRRAIAMFNKVNVDILGIVENMSYFVPPDMPDKKYNIFGQGGGRKVAKEFGTELLHEIPINMQMREQGDSGMPIVLDKEAGLQRQIFLELAYRVAKKVRILNNQKLESPELEISL